MGPKSDMTGVLLKGKFGHRHRSTRSFPGGSVVTIRLPTQEMRAQSLGREDTLEKEMAIHSSILVWEIPWTEEPGRLQSMGSKRVRRDLVTQQRHRGER